VLRAPAPVIASGGVSSLADITALAEIDGLGGIITGKALYEGRFDVRSALRAAAGTTEVGDTKDAPR
jgi:phosphoribosylformimino-5-aminoimidazole carboxamide ribonucleotide (ProFAR) isomerase